MKKVLGDKKMILLFLMPAFLVYLFVIFIQLRGRRDIVSSLGMELGR